MTTIDGETAASTTAQPRRSRALGAWAEFALKRALGLVATFFVAIVVTFIAIQLIPGDPALLAAGPDASPAQVEAVRESMGLNEPVAKQFTSYLGGAVRGDFGNSFSVHGPVSEVLMTRLPYTLALTGVSIVVVLLVSIPLGVMVGALTRNGRRRWLDSLFGAVTGLMIAIPSYVKATLLVLVMGIWLAWFPPAYSRNDVAMSMVLPVLALVLGPISSIARVTRRETAVVLSQDYVRTARGWRLATSTIYLKYVVRNTLTSALTLSGLILASMIGGAVIVEAIFAWPGLGLAVVNAIVNRDYPLIQGLILFLTMAAAVLIVVVDAILGLVDPRTLGSKS